MLLNAENLIQTNNESSAVQTNAHQDTHITINHLSDKVIEMYEERIAELKIEVKELKLTLNNQKA